jgi:hypothetical protein
MKTFFYTNHICADSAKVNQVVFALIAKVLPPPIFTNLNERNQGSPTGKANREERRWSTFHRPDRSVATPS